MKTIINGIVFVALNKVQLTEMIKAYFHCN